MENYQIKNPQVKQLYDYYKNIYYNTNSPKDNRINSFKKMELIKSIAIIYELDEVLDDEEFEDLLLVSNPIFPEDIPKLKELLSKSKIKIGGK